MLLRHYILNFADYMLEEDFLFMVEFNTTKFLYIQIRYSLGLNPKPNTSKPFKITSSESIPRIKPTEFQ